MADAKTRRCPTSNKGDGEARAERSSAGRDPARAAGRGRRYALGGKGRPCPPEAASARTDPDPSPRPAEAGATRRSRGPAAGESGSWQPCFSLLAPPRSRSAAGCRGTLAASPRFRSPRLAPGPTGNRSSRRPHRPSPARARAAAAPAHTCPPPPAAATRHRGRADGRERARPGGALPAPGGRAHVTRVPAPEVPRRDFVWESSVRARVFPRGGAGREPHGKLAGLPPPPRAPGAEGREGGRKGQLWLRQAALPPPPGSGRPAPGPAPGVSHPRGPCPLPSCRRRRCCQRSLN